MTNFIQAVQRAHLRHYAIPAFNVSNLEMTQSVLAAAVRLKSPVIIQTSEAALSYAGHRTLVAIIRSVCRELAPNFPAFLHLDHGQHLAVVKDCLRLGYDSVHLDASAFDLNKNIKLTKAAVNFARRYKVPVQGELGALLGREGLVKLRSGFNYRQMMTDPPQAKKFVAQTGVATLAINVGTIHGSFKGLEKIDLPRLRQIAKLIKLPLVLHGGSGNRPAALKQAIKAGISIINIDTDLRLAWAKALKKYLAALDLKEKVDPRQILLVATKAMEAEAARLIKIFGSANQA